MKLSSQTIVLCVALVAATTSVNASSRNLIRNRKATGRERRTRNLIQVESATTTLEEIVQIDENELVRALMETNGGMMSMSMSMPSMPSGGDSEDGGSGSSGSGSGTDGGEDGGSGSSESGGDGSSGGDSSTGGNSGSDSSSGGDSDSSGSGTDSSGGDGTTDMTPVASPTAVGEPTESGIPGSAQLDAPTGEETEGTEAPTSSASRQNAAIATTITIAFMVVPFIL